MSGPTTSGPRSGGPDLSGKVVVVTGAAGAAGPPLVRELVRHGAHVVAADRDADRLSGVIDAAGASTCDDRPGAGAAPDAPGAGAAPEAPGAGAAPDAPGAGAAPDAPAAGAEGVVVDLLDEAATRDWAARVVAEHGRVDGLLHLVGGWRGGRGIVESDLADWAWLEQLLVVTLQHASRAFHEALVASGGRLAIVSTPQAQAPTAKNASYAAAKAAAEAWTLAVADSFGDTGAAATIVQVKALLTDEMRAARPDRRFPGYTPVDTLARELVGLWAIPAADLNGTRRSLT